MKKRSPVQALCAAATLSLALVAPLAQAQNALDQVLASKVLKVAVPTDSAPYGFVGTDLQPQGLRVAVPPTVGFLVQVVKGTALASVIGFVELTKAGTMITNATFRPGGTYACVALMYFLLCFPVSACVRSLEKKLHGRR